MIFFPKNVKESIHICNQNFPVPNICIYLRGWKFDEKNTENKPQNDVLLLKE